MMECFGISCFEEPPEEEELVASPTEGAKKKSPPPKKLRKKVRRSRSPLLYPAKTSGGSDCFLQLTSEQAHIAKSEFPVSAFVSRVISRDGRLFPGLAAPTSKDGYVKGDGGGGVTPPEEVSQWFAGVPADEIRLP